MGCDFVALPGVALIGIFQSTHPSGVRRQGFPRSLRFSSISIHAPQWGATLSGWTDHVTVDYFNPRTPVGCDLVWDPREVIDYRFQSTHPSGVRPSIARRCNAYVDFNPRTPVGCDSCSALPPARTQYFNPRTPVGCDPTRYDKCPATGYFNPRTPVGCDRHRHAVRRIRQISIHAPQWGATRRWSKTVQPSRFQSTHPSGVRRWHPNTHASLSISIHAPQWGATSHSSKRLSHPLYFNPRTPVGCDGSSPTRWRRPMNFNPRTPVGCDVFFDRHGHGSELFQSTHPSGVRRGFVIHLFFLPYISIHAPQWGATGPTRQLYPHFTDFNPRTPVGCDLGSAPYCNTGAISIHAPQWGATGFVIHLFFLPYISIHAPQWGATIGVRLQRPHKLDFNPRTPVGCDCENGHSIP